MVQVSDQLRQEAIRSLESTIRKSQKALVSMSAKGASLTLVRERLQAAIIALTVLQDHPADRSIEYSRGDLEEARAVLEELLPQLESLLERLPEGSSQHTLLKRRIGAQKLAIAALTASLEK